MSETIKQRLFDHLSFIYRYDEPDQLSAQELMFSEETLEGIAHRMLEAMGVDAQAQTRPTKHGEIWSERDVAVITYGDSILSEGSDAPLLRLKDFFDSQLADTINTIHILPFNPFTSDDGFAVSDYLAVREDLGSWDDIAAMAQSYRVMGDLVINHCSGSHEWVEQFRRSEAPGKDYIFTAEPDDPLDDVVRPRTNDLLSEITTPDGKRYAWCTFSHDQLDLNFKNPELLLEIVRIIRHYLDHGVRIFRLDAVAFIWKKIGSNCLNLPQTHEIVRLLRTLVDAAVDDAVIITETNIPNQENLSYFGNLNEAHWIYNFSLPPLLVHTLVSGDSHYLKLWMMSMPPAQNGTAYFNFIASHDGIGLRPTEGLLSEREIDSLVGLMENFGGKVSYRALNDGKAKPYEINIALFDALQGTHDGPDALGVERFICAHTIMLALEGVPAFYIHSLTATRNDYERMERTGANRGINRHQWDAEELQHRLSDETTHHQHVFEGLKALIGIRKNQSAFHPNATQFTLHLDSSLFGFWRQSIDRTQSIFCVSNISRETRMLPINSINLISTDNWYDLISCQAITEDTKEIELKPYQTVWISNKLINDSNQEGRYELPLV